MSELENYKKELDNVNTTLFNLFSWADEKEEEIETLKVKNDKLIKCYNKLLLRFVKSEKERRELRREAQIIV